MADDLLVSSLKLILQNQQLIMKGIDHILDVYTIEDDIRKMEVTIVEARETRKGIAKAQADTKFILDSFK
jgi:hypothetical protein